MAVDCQTTTMPQSMAKIAAYRLIAGHLYNLLSMNIGLVNILLMIPSLHLSETAVRMGGHGKIKDEYEEKNTLDSSFNWWSYKLASSVFIYI